jgi:hypothetical protein
MLWNITAPDCPKQFIKDQTLLHTECMMFLFLQEKENDHEYWPPVDAHDHIAGKPRSNASADEEVSL